jgi:ketosteroid isomerase-like protein
MIRTKKLAFVLAFAVLPAAFGQQLAKADANTVEALKQFDNRVLQAEKARDVAALERYFAPTYTLTFPNGEKHDKMNWLQILEGPDHPVIESIIAANIHVYLFGDIAIVRDTTTVKSHDSKGQDTSGTFHVLRLMLRQHGMWRVGGVVMSPMNSD